MRATRFSLIVGVAATVLLAACVPTRTTKSAGEQVDDSTLTARVKTALVKELGASDSARTDVETFRGRVQLNGYVGSDEKKAAASRIARNVSGVSSVENNLRVATSSRSAGQYIDDNVITAKIKTAMARDPVVAAHEVNIDVRQGVVQLAGFVDSSEQKSRAGEIAREVEGVDRVDNQLEVKRR
jgi:hyperosmotically inducible periplasmic protein